MARLELAIANLLGPSSAFANVYRFFLRDPGLWAVGGSRNQPLVLYSDDFGRSFVHWSPPPTRGLRGVHVEADAVWVVGESGIVVKKKPTEHAAWKRIDLDVFECLHAIGRDANGRLWILGDNGLVLRSRAGRRRFEKVTTHSSARLLDLFVEPTCEWLVGDRMVQRTHGKVFIEVRVRHADARCALNALVRTPSRAVLVVGDGGLILRSTNDGGSWKKIAIDSTVQLEKLVVTRYGIFVIGDRGTLLVSHDDGRSFVALESELTGYLFAIVEVPGGLLIGGEGGRIWRLDRAQLALVMRAAFEARDPLIAALASRVHDGDDGAELVLDDALRERGLW